MNIDLLVFIKQKFLRILNYSQSFQEQVVTFSSVIILSEKEKNTEYSCTWIYLNIFLYIVYFIWCIVRYKVRQTLVPRNVTRSTKLRGAQHAPGLALKNKEFRSPRNLIFPALLMEYFIPEKLVTFQVTYCQFVTPIKMGPKNLEYFFLCLYPVTINILKSHRTLGGIIGVLQLSWFWQMSWGSFRQH